MSESKRRVFVTGLAAISPLGLDKDSTWAGLIEGRSGIGPISKFDTEKFSAKIAAEVRGFDPEKWMEPRDVKKSDIFTHYALAASDMLIEDAGLDLEATDRDRFGVVVGSGIGGLPMMEKQFENLAKRGPRRLSPFLIPAMIINMASGMVSMRHGLRGPNSSVVTACATANHAIGDAMRMIRYGDADIVLAGGTESTICPLSIGGFAAMKALSTHNDEPERASRPFDANRDGFVMGEGCGLLLLESEEHAKARGAKLYAELAGFGMSGDAYHMSAPPEDGNGMVRVMTAALADADLAPESIGYINAHGTATPTGDVIEVRAVRKVFGEHADSLHISSTKSSVGHLLGAAGGIESVISVLAMEKGVLPPTLNLEHLDPAISGEDGSDDIRLPVENFVPMTAIEKSVDAVLSNSFGFGGTNATLIFKKA